MTKKTGLELANKSSYHAGIPTLRPFIKDKMAEYGLSHIAHLATNESQYPPSPKVLQAMQEAMLTVNLYPDPSATLLRRKLAHIYKLKENMLIIGNGADELLYMIGKAFIENGDNAITSTPCYPTDIIAIESMGGIVRAIPYRSDFCYDLEAILNTIDEKTKIILLCTPANPSSVAIEKKELDAFMQKVPANILIVMDEAYKEFVTDKNAADPIIYLTEERNIIFLRTFSKYYGLAGLRIGYVLAPEHIINILQRAMPSFSVNSIAQAGALAALDDNLYYDDILQKIIAERNFLTNGLLDAGMKPVKNSQANFLFVNTCHVPSSIFAETLFAAGISILEKKFGEYKEYVRIAVGRKEQNESIITIAKDLCRKYKK